MKLKLFILFLLVFGAIGQTIFLNIDAKSNLLWENSKQSEKDYVHTSQDNNLNNSPVQSSEVVVTIRQRSSEVDFQNVNFDKEQEQEQELNHINGKKPCTQKTEQHRLICQKAKEAAKQKRVSGSNHLKNSTIQTPAP